MLRWKYCGENYTVVMQDVRKVILHSYIYRNTIFFIPITFITNNDNHRFHWHQATFGPLSICF